MTIARRLGILVLVLCLGLVTACGDNDDNSTPTGTEGLAAPTTARRAPTVGTTTSDSAPTTRGSATATDDGSETSQSQPVETTEDERPADPTTTDEDDTDEETPGSAEELPEGVVTALVLGSDSRENDFSGRSDVMVLVQLSADREHLNLVSIARDSYVDIPGHGKNKVNEAYAMGGIPLARDTVSDLMGGLEIDFVAQTNFDMFIALTRWMEGFWVDNTHETRVTVESTGRQIVFEEGRIFLENTDGLIYVRERKTMPLGDLDRTERHRAALVGMMDRLVEIREEEPEKLQELLPMLYQNVKIDGDLTLEQLMTMVDLASDIDPENITSLMVPVSHFGMTDGGASINVLDSGRTKELGDALRRGDLSSYVDKYGTSYALTGG
ncbi:LCP family protein [Ornithinicoccus hortensis]|uniref:LytR family transcriptional attenuator n=1 Tax=Ornithinicoccus hortensis TaxID=82346 RepID=A0A542YWQ1_9MICO|nr:LCP family protein [Ornithinicoccus hortensis]TQL48941.1 LytR family transcriptional attenuator [Ornithinicoccus hortensis]TQL52515.1 LytR family transcriptional attenuator [Ornithinicoccus hortensis]